MNFHISDEEIDAETQVIELGGEIDLYTAPEFKERMVELIEAGKKRIVVKYAGSRKVRSKTAVVKIKVHRS